MMEAIVDEIDGRRIRVGNHWLIDFASCNYLGFDLDPEIIAAVPEYLARWGTHPSWSRMIASPRLFEEIEAELTELLAAPDCLAMPTISLIHMSVIPALVGKGTVFIGKSAHRTIYNGALMAQSRGAAVERFDDNAPDQLDEMLRKHRMRPALVCIDGLHSMTGNLPPLGELLQVVQANDAFLYVDDGHGFGIFGERSPDELSPYGMTGNSVVRHLGQSYDRLILVAGLSKAYSSLLAFIACGRDVKHYLRKVAAPHTFSGPPPVASLATVQAGLRVNAARGDLIRADLHRKAKRVLDEIARIGLSTLNESGSPIIEVPIGHQGNIDALGHHLFESGIYVTLAPYPLVKHEDVGFRIQVTAAHTDMDISQLVAVLEEAAAKFPHIID